MSLHHRQLDQRRWGLVRRAVFERDGYRCVVCGRAGRLEGHHLVALEDGGDPYSLDNVETLCRDCHIAAHRRPLTAAEQAWRALVDELVDDLH